MKPDRAANMEIQDFRDGLAERLPEVEDNSENGSASIPTLQPYIASGSESMKSMPLVSISVNQTVPLRDVLFELAEQADYDLELDPRIRGSIIFTARERPFDQVVERIADIAGLRYRFEDDILRVELDMPYNKTYKIDYLSFIRTNKGSISNDTSVVTGDGADTGSEFESIIESEADFWAELDLNLQQILGGAASGVLRTSTDPRITATEKNPEVAAVAPTTTEEGEVQVQPPEAVLRVESLPVDDGSSRSRSRRGGGGDGIEIPDSTFAINKQAGLVSVFAPEKAHKQVQNYLKLLRRASTSQVLIEAKILEVALNDEYQMGIDWRAIDLLSGELSLNYLSTGFGVLDTLADGGGSGIAPAFGGTLASVPTSSSFVLGYGGNDVQALIAAVQGFGTVRALASPRLTVLNNQSAILNVATNQVFFEIDIDTSSDEGVLTVDVDSDIQNVPEGVLVNVQPSINLDDRTISMALRPTITRVVNTEPDPAVAFVVGTCGAACAGITSNIPELNVQEIDSVIQVRSGQAVVLGGLLQDRVQLNEDGVPVLSEVPVVGGLFRQHEDRVQKTELVIFLKATILDNPSDSVHNTDRDLYRAFAGDRRTLGL